MHAESDLMVALITGGHPFDVPNFLALFRSMPGVDCYPQDIENFAMDWGGVRKQYDALVFYNMHMQQPAEGPIANLLRELGETRQGLVVLHHALLAFPNSPEWTEMVGISDRSFGYHMGQEVAVEIADASHPITQGMTGWRMPDETYTMADAGPGSRVLLTTHHPLSMCTLAWTRTYRNARVFCFQSGHDNRTWSHPSFREVLARGIRWSAGRLEQPS